MLEIGIVETKSIIKSIFEKYSLDFSDYALTSFKQRLERSIELHNIKYVDIFQNKLLEDKQFFEMFLSELEVPSTEMFRDPSLWRIFREELIPALLKEGSSSLRIWLPNSVSGDELFSMCILLTEMKIQDQVQLYVSALSQKSLEVIRSGYFQPGKLSISSDNYIRANGKGELSDYYTNVNGELFRDVTLIKNVNFSLQSIIPEPVPQNIKITLYRNKMIYFNQTLQSKILKRFEQSLGIGTHLIVGTKEKLGQIYGNSDFVLANNSESIYKRKG